jgi:hypothetical protein
VLASCQLFMRVLMEGDLQALLAHLPHEDAKRKHINMWQTGGRAHRGTTTSQYRAIVKLLEIAGSQAAS